MKHKLVYTEGCLSFDLSIDEKPISEYSETFKRALVLKIVNEYLKESDLEDILKEYTSSFGSAELKNHCNNCQDNIYTYTVNV